MNDYQCYGYECRWDYLEDLAFQYGVDVETVLTLASELGESEDFDGLKTALDNIDV